MKRMSLGVCSPLALAVVLALWPRSALLAQETLAPGSTSNELDLLQQQINQQTRQLEAMRQSLGEQEANLRLLQERLNEEILANARARGEPAPVLQPSLASGAMLVQQAGNPAAGAVPASTA